MNVKVVLIPVSITDLLNRPLMDMRKQDFRLFEDGVEQSIAYFSSEDAPVSMGIVFDTSGSMKNRVQASLAALQEIFESTVPGDEYFAITFADKPNLVSGFTSSTERILQDLQAEEPHGWTALNDAICLAIHKLKGAHNARRVLFVLSDGDDNFSRYSDSETLNLVRESDVSIYAIGLFERSRFLKKVAEESGGRTLRVRSLEALADAVYNLNSEMRSQYLLGYTPGPTQNGGKYRKVLIQVAHPEMGTQVRVSWKRGYYAPEQ
jgi:VWFA-related protein